MLDFDESIRRPHTMPCGHTFCSGCISNMNDGGKVSCPTCRIEHRVPREGYFPICYAMEDLLRKLNKVEVTSAAATTGSQSKASRLSKSIRYQLEEREDKIKATIRTCQEVESQLAQYQTTLDDWCEQQQQLEDGLQRVIDQSKTARALMIAEKSSAAAKLEKLKEGEHEMSAVLENMRAVTTDQGAVQTIDSADRISNKFRLTAGGCVDRFPNVASVSLARKVSTITGATLWSASGTINKMT